MTFDRLLGTRRRRTSASTRVAGGLGGIAAGLGLMYFLDPRGGPRRRSQLVQGAERVLHDLEGNVGAGARDLSHRARGLAHETRVRLEREEVPDDILVERIRAKLGRLTSHPRALELTVRDGRVTLSGPVFRQEHAQLVRGVRWVRGVRGVEDRLEPRESAEGVPALQGAGPLTSARAAPLQRTFAGPGAKLLAGAAGGLLAARALLGSSAGRILAGVAGAAILGKVMGESGPAAREAAREARRIARGADRSARRSSEERSERGEHRGAWHPGPEVREVKSPAELEPGIATGSPEPTFSSRVDRGRARGGRSGARGERGSRGGRGWDAAGREETTTGTGSEDVSPRETYLAPPAGSDVRESDLGGVGKAGEEDREPERGGEGAARRDPTHDGG